MDPKKIILPNENNTTTPPKIILPNESTSSPKEIILPNGSKTSSSIELPTMKKEGESKPNIQASNSNDVSPETIDAGPQPGDKVATGKQLNEKGEVEDSSTKKTLKAVGRGAAAYFSGGSTIGKDSQVVNSAPVDKTIGVVSDQLEKVPGVEEISKELDEAGIADGVNDALDTVGNIKNGDVGGAIQSAKKLKDDSKKLKQSIRKKVMAVLMPVAGVFFLAVILVTAICGPQLGGFMDVVESEDGEAAEIGEIDYAENYGYTNQQQSANIAASVENYENLSSTRKAIIEAASAAVAAKVQYSYGSHPNGAGLRGIPSAGLDCAGFVQWALWTALEGNPGYLTTQAISDRIGKDFIEIQESELLPGDIGLKRTGGSTGDDYNHTGIYAGDGYWFHASSGKYTHQVVKSKYSEFKIFLRYKGVS